MEILTRFDWWAVAAFLAGVFLAVLYYETKLTRVRNAVRSIVEDNRSKALVSLLLYRAVRKGNDHAWVDFKLLDDLLAATFPVFFPEERGQILRQYRKTVVAAVGTVPENLEAVRQLVRKSKPV